MNNNATELSNALIDNIVRYLIDENFPRVIKCLKLLNEEEIWYHPNSQSNSIGNLVLHLNGNLNQWILDYIGGKPFERNRQLEFDAEKTHSKAELILLMTNLKEELRSCIQSVNSEKMLGILPIQNQQETGISVLIHITEHFSFHTGQIAYLTKWIKEQQINFY
jgi:uncharacterized damage-inducible protein DinB